MFNGRVQVLRLVPWAKRRNKCARVDEKIALHIISTNLLLLMQSKSENANRMAVVVVFESALASVGCKVDDASVCQKIHFSIKPC